METTQEIVAFIDSQVVLFNKLANDTNRNPGVMNIVGYNIDSLANQMLFADDHSRDWEAFRSEWHEKAAWASRVAAANR